MSSTGTSRVYAKPAGASHGLFLALMLAAVALPGGLAHAVPPATAPSVKGVCSNHQTFLSTAVHMMAMPSDSAEFLTQIVWWRGAHKNADLLDGGILFLPDFDGPTRSSAPAVADVLGWPTGWFNRPLVVPAAADIFCSSHVQIGQQQKWLVMGGTEPGAGETGTKQTRIFNPFTNGWEVPGDMAERRWYSGATALEDSKVVVSGGSSWVNIHYLGGYRDFSNAPSERKLGRLRAMPEGLFDTPVPEEPIPSLWPPALAGHTMNRYESSAHFNVVFGGVDADGVLRNQTWRITRSDNPTGADYGYSANNSLSPSNLEIPGARQLHAAVVIDGNSADDNKLVVWGGVGLSGQPVNDEKFWVYRKTPLGYSWNSFIPGDGGDGVPSLRFGHGMIADPKAATPKVFLFGGSTAASGTLASDDVWVMEFTNPARTQGTWKKAPRVAGSPAGPGALAEFAMTSFLAPHRIDYASSGAPAHPGGILYGGRTAGGTSNSTWLLFTQVVSSEDQVEWKEVTNTTIQNNPVPAARTRCTIGWADGNHSLFVFGGLDGSGVPTNEVREMQAIGHDAMDAEHVGEWKVLPVLSQSMHGATAALWDEAHFSRVVEMYTPSGSGGAWQTLNTANRLLQPWYPFNFLAGPALPGGDTRVFMAGPLKESYFIQPHGIPTLGAAGTSTVAGGSAVMYAPGRIMKSGSRDAPFYTENADPKVASKKTNIIDLGSATPAWTASGDMNFPRVNENLVVLPDGTVLCTGGTQRSGNSIGDTPVRAPEIWTPPNVSNPAGAWGGPLAEFTETRDYHNSAILLHNGRVLTGGGNRCPGNWTTCDSNDVKMRLFTPPQYFNGDDDFGNTLKPRARIVACDGRLQPGGQVTVLTDVAFDDITLVRGGSVTHGQDQSQLFVRPTVTTTHSSTKKTFDLPTNAWDLPPGLYQLFAMKDGMPSFARWVHVRVKGTFATGLVDIGDRVLPARTTIVRTSSASLCHYDDFTFEWSAPADDSTLVGVAEVYDVRENPTFVNGVHDGAKFSSAMPYDGEPAPAAQGTTQSMAIGGLEIGRTYRFAMVTLDDRPTRPSRMSNVISFQVIGCDERLLGGDPPTGGGFSSERTAGMNRVGQEGGDGLADHENSLLPGVVPGLMRTDLMPLRNAPAEVGDGYRLSLRRGHHGGSTLSDVRLVALDTAEEGCWVAEDGSFLAGSLVAATAVSSSAAGDVLAALGDDAQAHTANAGDTLVVTLPSAAGSDGMWLRTMGSPALGIGGDYGVLVQTLGTQGQWTTVQHLRPRRRYSDAIVRGMAGSQVRLILLGQTAISGLGRVVMGATAPSIHEAVASSAEHSRLGTLMATALAGVVLAADESMSVATSSLPQPAAGATRHWYLRVTGEHDAEGGSSARASQGHDEDAETLKFALHSVRPNPSHGRMTLSFTTPRAGAVRLEVFDLIGRRMASMVEELARPGRHDLAWEAKGQDGRRLSPGTYVVRLLLGSAKVERKVLVMP